MQDVIDFNLLKEYDTSLRDILCIWQKEKVYRLDAIVQYKGKWLKCTTAGTSGNTALNVSSANTGDTLTDGTVVWDVIGTIYPSS